MTTKVQNRSITAKQQQSNLHALFFTHTLNPAELRGDLGESNSVESYKKSLLGDNC